MKKLNASTLDLAMAALAGASVAFAVFALPEWRFQQAVTLSGLPLILSAAQPPLGQTARLLVAAVAGGFSFGLVWLVLRSIGKKPQPRKRPAAIEEIEFAPKIRRADAHPDAPARRPIFAGLDLGEPMEPEAEREPCFAPIEEEEIEQTVAEAAEPVEPAFRAISESEEPVEEPSAAVYEQDSIPHLMQRLELGLLRREQKAEGPGAANSVWPGPAPAEQERIDERLRGAIADLQRLAARSS